MRLLLDSCVWGPAAEELRAAGHDVESVSAWGGDPGDQEILRRSVEDDRILVTLDKDFGELVFVLGQPHRGILRLVNIRARDQGTTVLHVLARFGRELAENGLVVAEGDRVRVRMPESDL
jgi:predicted nuclease of predicted toxin-antitoxin system